MSKQVRGKVIKKFPGSEKEGEKIQEKNFY